METLLPSEGVPVEAGFLVEECFSHYSWSNKLIDCFVVLAAMVLGSVPINVSRLPTSK